MRLIADGGFDKKEIARAVVDGMRGSDVESADNSKVARRGVGLRESDDPVLAMLDVLAPENPLGDEARQLLIERARREPSDSDCDVEAVALKLRIRDALLDSRTEECVDRLARWVLPAYGEFRLLHEGEKFDEAVDRLIQELASPRAEASIGYRVAIEHALIALAGKQDQKSRDTLRVRIESLRQSRSARRRRSANQILDDWPHQEASPAG